jgi:hypothetical protein
LRIICGNEAALTRQVWQRSHPDAECETPAVGQLGLVALVVDDFDATYRRMELADVTFVGPQRDASYGRTFVFEDLCGNRWTPLGPLAA